VREADSCWTCGARRKRSPARRPGGRPPACARIRGSQDSAGGKLRGARESAGGRLRTAPESASRRMRTTPESASRRMRATPEFAGRSLRSRARESAGASEVTAPDFRLGVCLVTISKYEGSKCKKQFIFALRHLIRDGGSIILTLTSSVVTLIDVDMLAI
jgi:hypothetical protein